MSLSSFGFSQQVVTIIGFSEDYTRLMVRDAAGTEFEIDGTLRSKATGMPEPGERWMIAKVGAMWVPTLQIGAPAPPVITGDRDGSDNILTQILDALVTHGLVIDQTVPVIATPVPDDAAPTIDEATYGLAEPIIEADVEAEPDPEVANHEPKKPHKDRDKRKRQQFLWIGSYNVWHNLPNNVILADLRRLLRQGNGMVYGLQEFDGGDRSSVLAGLPDNWGYIRTGECVILWNKDEVKKLANGVNTLSSSRGTGLPNRYAQWGRFELRDTGFRFTVINTHLDAHVERGGLPNPDPSVRFRELAGHRSQTRQIAEMFRTMSNGGKHPVFCTGDFNTDYRLDHRKRHPDFPVAQFAKVGVKANWAILKNANVSTHFGSHGGRQIDYVWRGPMPKWMCQYENQRVLVGFRSDHRPVVVKMRVRARH